ncbi:MAG: hypothetical protein OXN25_16065 [Candidatus Poribacteria bacterium]|nr:hypothetical protein [Candidatus Poribacteria bacterium]MYK18650.1 hypothetical protein [Candidatus Poribacteria bacterium]
MKGPKRNRIKEVGKKTIADFIHSETGSVGIKNAAAIGGFIGALALSQLSSEAVRDENGNIVRIITIHAI